jgi:hypothetical protein
MDPVVLAAIIGALGTIAAAVVTWFLTSSLDKQPRFPALGKERRKALEGTWSGLIRQRQGPIRSIEIPNWEMKAGRRHIEGTVTLQVTHETKTITISLKTIGALIHGRYFKVEYRGFYQGDADFLQFGVGILELSMDAHSLKGSFVGIGPIAERIIDGWVELKKPFV